MHWRRRRQGERLWEQEKNLTGEKRTLSTAINLRPKPDLLRTHTARTKRININIESETDEHDQNEGWNRPIFQ